MELLYSFCASFGSCETEDDIVFNQQLSWTLGQKYHLHFHLIILHILHKVNEGGGFTQIPAFVMKIAIFFILTWFGYWKLKIAINFILTWPEYVRRVPPLGNQSSALTNQTENMENIFWEKNCLWFLFPYDFFLPGTLNMNIFWILTLYTIWKLVISELCLNQWDWECGKHILGQFVVPGRFYVRLLPTLGIFWILTM